MSLHCINIFLFSLMLNILVHIQRNHNNTITIRTRNATKLPITRLLCECYLYMSSYDNDPQMKKVMEHFNKQIQQRFHEYDDRMIEKRQKCKEQCNKEIQKIILKDKLEKQMEQQLTTLDTNITTEHIPTCVYEKSMADKVEKGCLKCGYGLEGALTSWQILGYTGIYGWANYSTALSYEAGVKAGIKEALDILSEIPGIESLSGVHLSKMINGTNFNRPMELVNILQGLNNELCDPSITKVFCALAERENGKHLVQTVHRASQEGIMEAASVQGPKVEFIKATTADLSYNMIVSGITIFVIVLVMVIIYLILRYRRKKK
ncbi:rifin PIR protein, putative [Plasmodium reichenowi]|uniref:Rifin PIR protein, putative n=1 Tax=Plasmodium reichenowi TaxID=5854 RepID=A0A2P9D5M3_PLARE|nr:rifin PIR protein, putative [Plasmodium reichenowi]